MSERESLAARGSERLATRRRTRRRRALFMFGVLLLLLFGAVIYGLRQSAVRIGHVNIIGGDNALTALALADIQGMYLWLIPRDSIFFFPASRIRADILAAHPGIAAVSIFRNGLTGLSIRVDNRVPIARWCVASSTPEGCYFFDASGFVYATTSATAPVNSFIVYESLTGGGESIGATLPYAADLPAAFDFARQLDALGSPVSRVVFHDDEVDEYLASGTRITYVRGHEQNAYTALVSARANLNLADGSIDYIDVRFDGKMYLKRNAK